MNFTDYIIAAASALAGYLCGGIMFCRLLPKIFCGIEISDVSSDGNPGATNVFRHCGIRLGIPCVLLDILKGMIPVFIAARITGYETIAFALIMIAPVLGHATAPFDKGPGGKCISTSFGVLLGLLPYSKVVLILAVIFILTSTVIKIKDRRIRSIVTFGAFALIAVPTLLFEKRYSIMLGCLGIAFIAAFKHFIMPDKTEHQEIQEVSV